MMTLQFIHIFKDQEHSYSRQFEFILVVGEKKADIISLSQHRMEEKLQTLAA